MLCALTVRKLKPGTFDQFRDAFMSPLRDGTGPEQLAAFHMLRSQSDPDEVICFGFFDASADEVRSFAASSGYAEQMEAIAPYVESAGPDGFYEIVEARGSSPAA